MEGQFEIGEGILMVYGRFYIKLVNPDTGKERVLASSDGKLLVDDSEIDYKAIWQAFGEGKGNDKSVRYGFDRYCEYKNGVCAFFWIIYPDGRWFADADGYGMKDNKEERAYCLINRDFEIIMPFRPVNNIHAVLAEFQRDTSSPETETKSEGLTEINETNRPGASKEITHDPFGKLSQEEREYIKDIEAMEPFEFTEDLLSDSGFCTPDISESQEEEVDDEDNPVLIRGVSDVPYIAAPLVHWEKNVGENIIIYCGKKNFISDSWWELEFDSSAFDGPRSWEEYMGEYEIFKLKLLKKGEFKIRVMHMRFEPYSIQENPDDIYYGDYGGDKVDCDFTIGVKVL